MNNKFRSVAPKYPSALVCWWLLAACDQTVRTQPVTSSQKSAATTEPAAALPPSAPAAANELHGPRDTVATVTSDLKVSTSGARLEETKPNSATAATIDLKAIVKPMLSSELFRLEPPRAQAYFASIAALQPKPSDESTEQSFAGPSELPWVEGVLLDLHDVDGRWMLGASQVTWRPPKAEARKLYERLVTEVKAARGRKPNFGRDESRGEKQQRFAGWTWCKQGCEAIVALDSSGQMSIDQSVTIDEERPAVLLKVYTPEGP